MTYHGLTDEEFSPRLQVLVDGRSMYSPAFRNGTNWALIPVALEDIERIEVVRGTNAVSMAQTPFWVSSILLRSIRRLFEGVQLLPVMEARMYAIMLCEPEGGLERLVTFDSPTVSRMTMV